MDDMQFDQLARAVADGSSSRRRLVLGLLSGGGAGFASLLGLGGRGFESRLALAAGDAACQNVLPEALISKNACPEFATSCGSPESNCVCIQTVGHKPRCVANFNPGDPRCPARDECGENRPCRPGFVCAKTQACCHSKYRKCLRRCPA